MKKLLILLFGLLLAGSVHAVPLGQGLGDKFTAEVTMESVLDLNGNLDISSEAKVFRVIDDNAAALDISEGTTNYLRIITSNSNEEVEINQDMDFNGDMNLSGDLDVNGGNLDAGCLDVNPANTAISAGSSGTIFTVNRTSTGYIVRFMYNSSDKFRFAGDGTGSADNTWNTFCGAPFGQDVLSQIKGIETSGEEWEDGLLKFDKSTLPKYLVSETIDDWQTGEDENGDPIYESRTPISIDRTAFMNIIAIQELVERVEKLEAKVINLEKEVEELKK